MRVNLKQLSEIVGLSQTTISRALNGYPEVSEKTRLKIMEAARNHGYRPNRTAQNLALGKAGIVGFVMNTNSASPVDPHFMQYLGGIGETALERGFDLQICPSTDESELTTYQRLKDSGQVDAVIVSSPYIDEPRIAALIKMGLPFIVHGRSETEIEHYDFLDIDNEDAFYKAGKHLIELGHKKIALINGPLALTFAHHRQLGLERALSEHGLSLSAHHQYNGEMSERLGYSATKHMLESKDAPTAIICASMLLALGTVRAASDLKRQIGSDISVIAHDDDFPYLSPENFRTPITTTHSPIRDAGKRIMEKLADKLEHKETAPQNEIWPVELVIRASTGQPKQ